LLEWESGQIDIAYAGVAATVLVGRRMPTNRK
jgi:hypothetical protein